MSNDKFSAVKLRINKIDVGYITYYIIELDKEEKLVNNNKIELIDEKTESKLVEGGQVEVILKMEKHYLTYQEMVMM